MQAYKCFIIRLKDNAHSCKIAKDCFDQAVKYNIVPEYFDAVNGNNADFHYERLGIRKAGKFKKDRPGVMGCFLSHFYLWMQCVEENLPFIILEHDGYFIKELSLDVLSQFDDVLKLDRLDPYSSSYNTDIDKEFDLPVSVNSYQNLNPKVKTRIGINTNYFNGAYSYIIKPAAAKKLINFIKENGHVPADQQLNSVILDLKTTIPTVARLHPFYAIGDNIKTQSLTRNLNGE